jgi:hypothetical protein
MIPLLMAHYRFTPLFSSAMYVSARHLLTRSDVQGGG